MSIDGTINKSVGFLIEGQGPQVYVYGHYKQIWERNLTPEIVILALGILWY